MFFQTPIESITVGEQVLPIVKTRRKKSIGIKPKSNLFELHVPRHLSERALRKILNDHKDWISDRVKQLQVTDRAEFSFKAGDCLLYQGESYAFEVLQTDSLKNPKIELVNQQCLVTVPIKKWQSFESIASQQAWLKALLQAWYKQQAETYFSKTLSGYAQQIGVTPAAIQVKTYKARWGSCYPDGRIQFNWRLMQAPAWVIDYVIVHELCHLKHANHSPAFWNLVEKHYSRTQKSKLWLKQNQTVLIGFLS